MKLILINTGKSSYLENCLNSLLSTLDSQICDLIIVKEKEYREVTLNYILSQYGNDDLLIFGDDIIFTKGWFTALIKNIDRADIIGFSMLYPKSEIIQDNGYFFVMKNNIVSYYGDNKGTKLTEKKPFDFRYCDALCGCAMFIKKSVIDEIPFFPLDGQNRWGELLYQHLAKKNGFKIGVVGHYLYHYGKGTKKNQNLSLRTESYSVEKKLWDTVVEKYIDPHFINYSITEGLSASLIKKLKKYNNILFYGAGTVTELILSYLKNDLSYYDICSGLIEEEGFAFAGKKIIYYKNVDYEKYDLILITVLGKSEEIMNSLKEIGIKSKIEYISKNSNDTKKIIYEICEVN